MVTAVAYEAADRLYEELKTNKKVKWVVNGMSIVIDSTTNGFDDAVNQGNPDAIAKAIVEGLVAGAATWGTAVVMSAIVGSSSALVVGGVALTAYVVGNQVASLAGDGWEYIIGPNSDVTVNTDLNDIKILSEGSTNDILNRYWDGRFWDGMFGDSDKVMHDKETWIIGSLDSNEWTEKTGDNSYEFSNTLANITKVGKEYDSGVLFNLVKNYLEKEDIANGFYITTSDKTAAQLGKGITYVKESKSSLQGLLQTDDKAQYAVWKQEPFVFENTYENLDLNLNDFSDNYISDRLDFYKHYVNVDNPSYYYYDAETGKSAGDKTYYSGDFPVKNASIIFSENGNIQGSGYGDRLYGGKGDNVISGDIDFEGQGADYIEGGLGSDIIYAGGKDDTIYTNAKIDRKYDYEDESTTNTVYAGAGADKIYGSNGRDIIYGDFKNESDYSFFDFFTDYDDLLIGGKGSDELYGGAGNDTLIGGITKEKTDNSADTLKGGEGYDTYIAGNGDTIMDDDHKGIVYFEKEHLTGGVLNEEKGVYEGDGGEYTLLGDILTFKDNNGTLTIKNYHKDKHSLGITLQDPNNKPPNDMDDNNTGDEQAPCPEPINPLHNLNIPLPQPKPKPVTSSGGSYSGGSYSGGSSSGGSSGGSYTSPSTPHSYTPPAPAPEIECVNTPQHHSAGKGGGGDSTGPIVLDLNRDSITSISLAASQALFDYDGDSVKENTAWIQSEDALLVNDKNSDNIINDASELFGNYTINSDGTYAKSGYQALYDYDSNNDNVIDNNDERFSELKLWIDANQDGQTDAGELKSLEQAGVSSLQLSQQNYLPQSEEGNTIVQQTSFTDTNGEGIMRDVLFSYENNSNPSGGVYFDMDANGIQEKMITWMSPNEWLVVKDLNGDGKITSGAEVVGNHMITSQGKKEDTIQALKTFDSNNDGIIDEADNSDLAFWTDRNYNGVTDVGELQSLGEADTVFTQPKAAA